MSKQEKLAELHSIRTTLDKVAKNYCTTPEERKTVKEIALRLFTEQILPLAEELTAYLVKKTAELRKDYTSATVQLVDLGLPSGTLWADRNIGADAPEDAGDYFRIGETIAFTEDSPEYVYNDIEGSIAGTKRDAATVNLGKNYQTPTVEQIMELFTESTWTWTEQDGVNGIKVTGPNGNSIFFPASGYRNYSSGSLDFVGCVGFFWSASPNSGNDGLGFILGSVRWFWAYFNRAYGFPVRAVAL